MSATARGAARRLAVVLLACTVAGAAGWWAVGPIRRVFLLPDLFVPVARGLLFLGLVVVVAAAWRYPEMGEVSSRESRDGV